MKTLHIPADAADPDRFRAAVARIDETNSADPRSITIDGQSGPYELGYSVRLTAWILRREAQASERILLAARAQHLKRWALPRTQYPEGLNGYLSWRENLKAFHAEEAGCLLDQGGYSEAEILSVQQLIRKERFPVDPDTRVIEDGLCLVFMDLQLAEFMTRHPEEKVLDIIQKTWGKMSEEGQALALTAEWDAEAQAMIEKALADDAQG